MDATDSIYRAISIESNQFLSTSDSVSGGLYAQHTVVTSTNYDVGGSVQVYAHGADISFNNNSLVATDILTFIIYSDTFVIDIESGLITK